MPAIEDRVSAHYTTDDLIEAIKAGLLAAGANPIAPRPEDLKPVDEFHTGGILATDDLLDQLEISPDTLVLDIGAGLGGTARHIARTRGATVTGIDLTEAYVETAQMLSKMVGMAQTTAFRQASALDICFTADSFDLATMFHVGMNIADKETLMAEVHRVLEPGGCFALFDIMAEVETPQITFPVPWAETADLSFVATPETYRSAAKAAGFVQVAERARGQFALDYFAQVFKTIEAHGTPPLGLHLLMRGTGPQKLRNYVAAVEAGALAPYEMIFRKAA